jgi:hypothetical protein
MPRESFWKSFIAGLSSDFFVINNLDKETGLINVSYSGDPERFVDCGRVKTEALGQVYEFPGARASQQYQIISGLRLFKVNRQMALDGRINILAQEVDPKNTSVTVNTRYVINRRVVGVDQDGRMESYADSVSFNYGQDGLFAAQSITCRSTGMLERQILLVAQKVALSSGLTVALPSPIGNPTVAPAGITERSSPAPTATTTPVNTPPASQSAAPALQISPPPAVQSARPVRTSLAQLYLISGPTVSNPPQSFNGEFSSNGEARVVLAGRRVLTGNFDLFETGQSIQAKYQPKLIKPEAVKPLAGTDAKGFAALSDGTGLQLECIYSIKRATGRGEGTCADNQRNTYKIVFD